SEEGDIVRVFEMSQPLPQLLGVGEVTEDGRVAPKRLVVR
ncbi:MAG: hypothetical protein ACJA0O_001229, partial [Porticoccus sp.]